MEPAGAAARGAQPRRLHAPSPRRPRGRPRLGGPARRRPRAARAPATTVALDLQGLWKSAAWARASGARRVIGFAGPWRREPLSELLLGVPHPARRGAGHVIDKNLALLRALEHRRRGPREFPLPPARRRRGASTSSSPRAGWRDFAVLNPGGGWASKLWPPARSAPWPRAWPRAGSVPVVTWGPGEEALADARGRGVGGNRRALLPDHAPRVRRRSRGGRALVVAADTGPLHLACAVGTPVVGALRPHRSRAQRPVRAPTTVTVRRAARCARPCHRRRCSIHEGVMAAVPPARGRWPPSTGGWPPARRRAPRWRHEALAAPRPLGYGGSACWSSLLARPTHASHRGGPGPRRRSARRSASGPRATSRRRSGWPPAAPTPTRATRSTWAARCWPSASRSRRPAFAVVAAVAVVLRRLLPGGDPRGVGVPRRDASRTQYAAWARDVPAFLPRLRPAGPRATRFDWAPRARRTASGARRPRCRVVAALLLARARGGRPRRVDIRAMGQSVSRRDFVRAGTGIVAAGRGARLRPGPRGRRRRATRPVVISSANGNALQERRAAHRGRGGLPPHDPRRGRARRADRRGQHLRAGPGGRQRRATAACPTRSASCSSTRRCMHGPKRRAGAVAALEGVRTPSLVARAVADLTDHHLLVGTGAQEFARGLGFKIEDDLNTENSRKQWLEWKRRIDPEHYLDPAKRARSRARGVAADDRRGADRPPALLRHDQLQRRERQGRGLRRHHHQRPGLEDPGARGRLADPRRRALRGRRGRGRRLHRARRGQPLQPVLPPHRRGDAPRPASQGRGDGGAAADPRQHGREAPAATRKGNPDFNVNFYVVEPARRASPGSPCTGGKDAGRSRSAPRRARRPLPCDVRCWRTPRPPAPDVSADGPDLAAIRRDAGAPRRPDRRRRRCGTGTMRCCAARVPARTRAST